MGRPLRAGRTILRACGRPAFKTSGSCADVQPARTAAGVDDDDAGHMRVDIANSGASVSRASSAMVPASSTPVRGAVKRTFAVWARGVCEASSASAKASVTSLKMSTRNVRKRLCWFRNSSDAGNHHAFQQCWHVSVLGCDSCRVRHRPANATAAGSDTNRRRRDQTTKRGGDATLFQSAGSQHSKSRVDNGVGSKRHFVPDFRIDRGSVSGEIRTLRAGEGLFIGAGKTASLRAGNDEPSVFLHFLLAPAADQPVETAPATVKELYRTAAPLPDLKPGRYDLNLTRVTFPARMPSNPPHHRSGAALYYIISGTGTNTIEGKVEAKGPGSLIYEPFGLVHQWGNPGHASHS
jgi:mannose-6-phosphate isomerase-like protein (cupin superfamily)